MSDTALKEMLGRYAKVLKHRAKNIRMGSSIDGWHYYSEAHDDLADELEELLLGSKKIEDLEDAEYSKEQEIHDLLRLGTNHETWG